MLPCTRAHTHTHCVRRRYAILDGPGFPIVAEGDEEPNDTFVQQLTDSARAAVEVRRRPPRQRLQPAGVGCILSPASQPPAKV
jgi:hypothetical protein